MEEVENGTVLDFLVKSNQLGRKLSKATVLYLIANVLRAVHYLHTECGLAHLDIKPDNIMLDAHLHTKLIDFGSADQVENL